MTECGYIHRCLYEGDMICAVRAIKLPEIQARLDAVSAEVGISGLVYKLTLCQNCRMDSQLAELREGVSI